MKSSGNETATESAETLDAPSTDTPPARTSPVDTPPADIPPTDTPPARTSPVGTPPADTPPADIPPAGIPPAETPSNDTPSNDTPSAGTPSETAAGTADEPSTNEVSVENTAQAATDTGLHKHTSVRPSILDGSGHFLEDILRHVLEAGDTSRKPDSAVPGTIDALAKTDPAVFARLMTCAAVNWVESNRATTRAALYCEQERLREVEKARLDRIADDRVQMNVTIDERLSSEISYQQEEKRLKRSTQNAIASLNLRKEADKILLGITSEPVELTGDFRDASDLDGMIKEIEKDDAKGSKDRQRKLWKETYYWPAIQQRAKMEGPLPNPSGRKIDMSPQERLVAKRVIPALKYGKSRDSIMKGRSYLKLLSELREAGVKSLLLCRTPEFKTHFWRHPNELNMLLSWNQLYDPYLQQLRLRVIAEEGNDFSGKCDIQDENIKKRLLLLPQMMADWRNDFSDWDQNSTEKAEYLAHHNLKATSGKSNEHVLRYGIKGDLGRNKAIFVALIPYEGVSGKKTISSKPASTELLAVAPLISVSPGDFLGIFSGQLRYVDEKPARAMKGPVQGLWLDYSKVPGNLSRMKVAKAGEKTNVCLAWEGVNELKGKKAACQYWRVLVLATRHIMPFDQLVRPA